MDEMLVSKWTIGERYNGETFERVASDKGRLGLQVLVSRNKKIDCRDCTIMSLQMCRDSQCNYL